MPRLLQRANGTAAPEPKRPPGLVALNVADLAALDATVIGPLLAGRLADAPAVTGPAPDDRAAVLACPLAVAACVADVVRAYARAAGLPPPRAYYRRAAGARWAALDGAAVLARAAGGTAVPDPVTLDVGVDPGAMVGRAAVRVEL